MVCKENCNEDSQCGNNKVCHNGECISGCAKDDHCNNHGTCNLNNGKCNCDQDWDLQLDCSGM